MVEKGFNRKKALEALIARIEKKSDAELREEQEKGQMVDIRNSAEEIAESVYEALEEYGIIPGEQLMVEILEFFQTLGKEKKKSKTGNGTRAPKRNLRIIVRDSKGKSYQARSGTIFKNFLPDAHNVGPEGVLKFLQEHTELKGDRSRLELEEKEFSKFPELELFLIAEETGLFQNSPKFKEMNKYHKRDELGDELKNAK